MHRLCVAFLSTAIVFAAQAPPSLRLPDTVRPIKYTLDLRLIPEEEVFSGTIAIDVDLKEATPIVWLNATELKIAEASLQIQGRQIAATVIPGGREFIGLQPQQPVGPGPAQIHIRYSGVLNKNDVEGLFKQTEKDSSYIFTQFEPTSARRAFPCFDEPLYKIPWQLTIHARKQHVVVANTPIESETDEPGGLKAVRFRISKPLPTYLVAIAVGPFDVVEGGRAGRNKTPLRIITAKGRGVDTKWATEVTPKIIASLEQYFGVPYPYEKLDQVTIPVTVAFGAMENAGLITYQQNLLVMPKDEDTIDSRRSTAEVIAHELAHQWFGNMITPYWWDDIWLNEAFATWMETKIDSQLFPDWNVRASAVRSKYGAMAKDTLVSARTIRQPIENIGDIGNAFDSITYQKGSAVIRMFEQYLGEQTFQRGVRAYMKKYAWGNASATDFLASISAAAGKDIAPAFNSFLNRTGVPLINVELQCVAGSAPKVVVKQERLVPLGSSAAKATYWQLPVCFDYPNGNKVVQDCSIVADPKDQITLTKAKSCPAWVNANSDAAGYYQVRYDERLQNSLIAHSSSLSLVEKVELLRNAASLVSAGQMPANQALTLVSTFKNSQEQEVVTGTADVLRAVRQDVPPELLPKFAEFVRSIYSQRARQIGWASKPGESSNSKLMRDTLIDTAANYGDDPELVSQSQKLAEDWLSGKAVDPDMTDTILATAAAHGDRAFFDKLVAEARKSPDRQRRSRIYLAIGNFRDPELVRAGLDLTLNKDLDIRETMRLLTSYLSERSTETIAWEFLKVHYDDLLPRLPSRLGTHAGSNLPSIGKGFCSEQGRQEVADFFKERIKPVFGGERTLAETLESIHLCEQRRKAQEPAVRSFLGTGKL